MKENRAVYPVRIMSRVLGVSPSGFYAWLQRPPSKRAETNAVLAQEICSIHSASRGTYGAPRVWAELAAQGVRVGRKRVARLMCAHGLEGAHRRRYVATTVRNDARPAPDLVDRQFRAEAPNRLWVADITYIPSWAGFLYLAVVLDAFSRRIVGWSFATSLTRELVLAALDMALEQRRPKGGVIHHSDQGTQYTSLEFGRRCREANVRLSMGSVGDAYDNAMCESFFATLECELLQRRSFKTQIEARLAVFEFIEGFYNPRRRHSALGYLSPIEFEKKFAVERETPVETPHPDSHDHPAVLGAVKAKPFGRPAAGLDSPCARRERAWHVGNE
jgi:putative transposase